MTSCRENACSCLELILEYHAKTRTLDQYILQTFEALSNSNVVEHGQRLEETDFLCPLLDVRYVQRVRTLVGLFLTPNQVRPLVDRIIEYLVNLWREFALFHDDTGTGRVVLAAKLLLGTRFSTFVLTSLPVLSLEETVRIALRQVAANFHDNVLSTAICQSLSKLRQMQAQKQWGLVAHSFLRMHYFLNLPQSQHVYGASLSRKVSHALSQAVTLDQVDERTLVEIVSTCLQPPAAPKHISSSSVFSCFTSLPINYPIRRLSWSHC
jgi:hypothetical protein